jgi:hypothetical protein
VGKKIDPLSIEFHAHQKSIINVRQATLFPPRTKSVCVFYLKKETTQRERYIHTTEREREKERENTYKRGRAASCWQRAAVVALAALPASER